MRALICSAFGDPPTLSLGEMPSPRPAADELLVDVEAVGLGYFDTVLLRGIYQEKPALPFVPGREFCGVVAEAGTDMDAALVGKRIAGISFTGCLAERALVKRGHFMVLPDGMDPVTGSAFLSAYATMLYALENCGAQKPGERVLVLGAAGTVGQAAIDIARALGGHVVAAASAEAKRAAATARGAHGVTDYTAADWRDQLRAAAPTGFDIVVDPVGGGYSETAFRHLAPGGRHLVIGFSAGEVPRLPFNLPLLKRASLVGVDWGGFSQQEPEANAALLLRLHDMLADGRLTPKASRTYGIGEVGEVVADLQARRSIGKPVILLRGKWPGQDVAGE